MLKSSLMWLAGLQTYVRPGCVVAAVSAQLGMVLHAVHATQLASCALKCIV